MKFSMHGNIACFTRLPSYWHNSIQEFAYICIYKLQLHQQQHLYSWTSNILIPPSIFCHKNMKCIHPQKHTLVRSCLLKMLVTAKSPFGFNLNDKSGILKFHGLNAKGQNKTYKLQCNTGCNDLSVISE